jgi:acyl carrier protein
MSNASTKDQLMESTINAYISQEIITKPELLPLKNDTSLIKGGVLDSLSLLKLVLFIENRFGIIVNDDELTPDHFETIDTICAFLRSKKES